MVLNLQVHPQFHLTHGHFSCQVNLAQLLIVYGSGLIPPYACRLDLTLILGDSYKFNSLNILPTIEKPITEHTKHSIATREARCEGRVWNKGIVKIVDERYIYGAQCSRTKKDDSKYCGIHSRSEGHGNFFEHPPHEHFKKYIIIIISSLSLLTANQLKASDECFEHI